MNGAQYDGCACPGLPLSIIASIARRRASARPTDLSRVIALTADVTSGGREHYQALGFTEHEAKPIQVRGLMEAMARALDAPATPILRKLAS